MIINFKTRGISKGARKLTRTLTLIQKNKKIMLGIDLSTLYLFSLNLI